MLDAVVHWLHLMAAILWVGGTLFTSVVIQPVLRRELPEAARMSIYREVGRRLTKLQWITWGVLISTGLWKIAPMRWEPELWHGPFGRVLAVKLSLVALMMGLSLVHSFVWGPALVGGGLAPAARAALAGRAAFWGKVNGLVLMGIVFCAALLRYNPW